MGFRLVATPRAASASEWMRRARRHLRIALVTLEEGFPEVAAFYAQQAAEFALKALQVKRKATFDRVHDLKHLARDLSAPPEIEKDAAQVSPAYVASRYPDAGGQVTKSDAEITLKASRRIVAWVRRHL